MANRIFSQKEMAYIKSRRLARIATAASSEEKVQGEDTSIQPDVVQNVVPVGFDFDVDYFYVGLCRRNEHFKVNQIQKRSKK